MVIYANVISILRNVFWNSLASVDLSDVPWCLISDFNCLLDAHDKQGGLVFSVNYAIRCFRDFIYNSGLMDLGFSRRRFTWSNNRQGWPKFWLDWIGIFPILDSFRSLVIPRFLI